MCVTSVPEFIPTPCYLDVCMGDTSLFRHAFPSPSDVFENTRPPRHKPSPLACPPQPSPMIYKIPSCSPKRSEHIANEHYTEHESNGPFALHDKFETATMHIRTQTSANANFSCLRNKCMQDWVCLLTHLI